MTVEDLTEPSTPAVATSLRICVIVWQIRLQAVVVGLASLRFRHLWS
jgi:hypothetical protein